MDMLEEIVDYCTMPVSMGAILLNGAWGSGKTHFMENDVKEALKETHVFVRVSLFGLKSIDAFDTEVRRQWLVACNPLLAPLEKYNDEITKGRQLLEQGMTVAGTLKPSVKGVQGAASITSLLLEYFPITHQIKTRSGHKEVVLVFDDLERCKLDMTDVMGRINEYCENQRFKVVIIANEEKIGALVGRAVGGPDVRTVYRELKAKTVSRTLRYKPDLRPILRSVLSSTELFDEEYRQFLLENERLIADIFSTAFAEQMERTPETPAAELPAEGLPEAEFEMLPAFPSRVTTDRLKEPDSCDIRMLKCALQDFARVYRYMSFRHANDMELYLYHFLAYYIMERNGMLAGRMQNDEIVKQAFPQFDPQYLSIAARKWIRYGEWDEREMDKADWSRFSDGKEPSPAEQMRAKPAMEWEEKDIETKFTGLLLDAYEGRLTLNEYVTFIQNAAIFRGLSIALPQDIDWEKLKEGIRERINRDIQDQAEGNAVYRKIQPEQRARYTPEELNAYDLIEECGKKNIIASENAKNLFLRLLSEQGVNAFTLCAEKPVMGFDAEMAQATVACFDQSPQAVKMHFPALFADYWRKCCHRMGVEKEAVLVGLSALKEGLGTLCSRYAGENRPIAACHAEAFMKKTDELTEQVEAFDADKLHETIINRQENLEKRLDTMRERWRAKLLS